MVSSPPPSVLPRQLSALALIPLLYTAAMPFTPLTWLTGPANLAGTYLFDRLLAGLILFSAFYFQWAIASLRGPAAVVIALPTGASTSYVRDGRVERVAGGLELGVWRTGEYWFWAAGEAGVLLVAEFGGSELLRRVLIGAVVAGLWVVGWAVTPGSVKRWAWERVKVYLFVLVLDELRNVGMGAVGGRRRRTRW